MTTPESAVTLTTPPGKRHQAGPEFPQRGALGVALAPQDPLVGDLQNAYPRGPGRRFVLGPDTQGRDVLSRVLFGARLSLLVGVVCQSLAVTRGVLLGLVAPRASGATGK